MKKMEHFICFRYIYFNNVLKEIKSYTQSKANTMQPLLTETFNYRIFLSNGQIVRVPARVLHDCKQMSNVEHIIREFFFGIPMYTFLNLILLGHLIKRFFVVN